METKLKKYGQMLLGVAILGTAVLTQSFTEKVKKMDNIHRYYSITGTPSANLSDYVYYDEDDQLCRENEEKICSKQFNLGSNSPTVGQAPPSGSTPVPSSEEPGEFQEPAN
ncbi:hypothetical protein [Sphingobacterium thalpophilum]|uniref:hypothetical protein n=1 Tax=Sphingobacterium thalpophilum TaxID=259 RepID=UPI0031D5ABA0